MNTQEREERFLRTAADCQAAMYRVAYGMLHNATDAEDAVSAAVEAAWRRQGSLRDEAALPGYLMRCAINACHTMLRRRKREFSAESLEQYAPAQEAPGGVWEYLHHLPEKYSLPLMLRYGENWEILEIARFLHVPKGTVSSRLSRGLAMLRREMEGEDAHDE